MTPYPQIGIFGNYLKRQLYSLAWWQIYQFYIFVIPDILAFWISIIYIGFIARKFSLFNKLHIFQCLGKLIWKRQFLFSIEIF